MQVSIKNHVALSQIVKSPDVSSTTAPLLFPSRYLTMFQQQSYVLSTLGSTPIRLPITSLSSKSSSCKFTQLTMHLLWLRDDDTFSLVKHFDNDISPTLSFPTLEETIMGRLSPRTAQKVLAPVRNGNFVQSRLAKTASNTSGWIYAASTNPTAPNYKRQSTRSFAGPRMPPNATYTYPVCRIKSTMHIITLRNFGIINCLGGVDDSLAG